MARSSIEWTESTWNPVTGCSKVSPGCEHCYAERMALRLRGMGHPNYTRGFRVSCHPHMLQQPLTWRTPRMVFVNSMGDLFHEDVPSAFIHQVLDVMRRAYWHTFQVLTKRSDRLRDLGRYFDWPPNVWAGVSVENEDYTYRIDHLRAIEPVLRFLSLEPLLGPMSDLDLLGIGWVIVGGESGPGARRMDRQWVLDIRDQCQRAGVPFFFKQWGGFHRKRNGRLLDGRTYDETPAVFSHERATAAKVAEGSSTYRVDQ